MVSHTEKLPILIAGATGQLGTLITKHALANPKLQVNILVRDPAKNKELTESVEKAGGKVFKADVTDSQSLKGVAKGIHTVISVVNSMDDKIAVDGQVHLLNEAVASGAKRFIPSDFGVNYVHFNKEELNRSAVVAPKFRFQEHLDKAPIKQLHFYQGAILETFFHIQSSGLHYWGNGDFKLDFTSYDNIAQVVAAAVSNPDLTGKINYAGDRQSIHDVAKIYNKVRGTNVEPQKKGSLEDLKKIYEDARQKGDPTAEYLGLFLILYDPRSVFEKINNADFPSVKATSVEEYLHSHPEIKFP